MDRKQDHIDLAFASRPELKTDLQGHYYEPLFAGHSPLDSKSFSFAGKTMKYPFWVSSMTGGTQKAHDINHKLARVCNKFGLGMGLGSCRPLLEDTRWEDFDLRPVLGSDCPLYTNFGIAQLEDLLDEGKLNKIDEITHRLQADGIIIHVNPLQEWAQPEGDRYRYAPLETIEKVLEASSFPIIVKEVGQGFGPRSLRRLVQLPLQAIEFAGFGGTNFTMLEQARRTLDKKGNTFIESFASFGHSPQEMIQFLNSINDSEFNCRQFIISGGITDPVQAYLLKNSLQIEATSVIGMASAFLKYALMDDQALEKFTADLIEAYQLCENFLRKETNE